GALWFTPPVARITTSGVITGPTGVVPGAQYIATGPDHKLWVTETNKIACVEPSNPPTLIAEYTLPSSVSTLGAVTRGPHGNVWFTEPDHSGNAALVAWITLTKLNGCVATPTKCITEWVIPGEGGNFGLTGITAGPAGAIWLTTTLKVNRIPTAGAITQFTAA